MKKIMENLEVYYTVLSAFNLWGGIALTAYCYYVLIEQFMRGIKHLWLVAVAYFITMGVLYYIPPVIDNFLAYALGTAAGFLTMYLLERRNTGQKIFLSVTFFSLRWLSATIVRCILEQISSMTGRSSDWRILLGYYAGECIAELLLFFLFLIVSVKIISKVYTYKREIMTGRELALLLVPSLCVAFGYAMQSYYLAMIEEYTGESPFRFYYSHGLLNLFYYGISFATILITIVLFQGIKQKQRDEQQTRLIFSQVKDMKKHISEVEKLYCDIRRLKHDMGNHIITLESLWGKKQYEEAGDYVAHLKESFHDSADKIKSGNPVTDVILLEKSMKAEEKGISFACDFHYPEGAGIDAFDISIILNNALDNAIEAAGQCKEPWISIISYRRKNACMIEVRNSLQEMRVLDEESGLPVTTKNDGEGHGFGLLAVRRTAQKYCGDIDIKQDGVSFMLSIMLMAE